MRYAGDIDIVLWLVRELRERAERGVVLQPEQREVIAWAVKHHRQKLRLGATLLPADRKWLAWAEGWLAATGRQCKCGRPIGGMRKGRRCEMCCSRDYWGRQKAQI